MSLVDLQGLPLGHTSDLFLAQISDGKKHHLGVVVLETDQPVSHGSRFVSLSMGRSLLEDSRQLQTAQLSWANCSLS